MRPKIAARFDCGHAGRDLSCCAETRTWNELEVPLHTPTSLSSLDDGYNPDYPGRSCFRLPFVKLSEDGTLPDREHLRSLFINDYEVGKRSDEGEKCFVVLQHSAAVQPGEQFTQQQATSLEGGHKLKARRERHAPVSYRVQDSQAAGVKAKAEPRCRPATKAFDKDVHSHRVP
ncbi:hypothetical protein BR93DRAFT_923793 [Coniochaeta sp. PMI_546]|nr:hypothetical protein BR93DRAFT_923793 [Coniochaeta sp. PMI_546]